MALEYLLYLRDGTYFGTFTSNLTGTEAYKNEVDRLESELSAKDEQIAIQEVIINEWKGKVADLDARIQVLEKELADIYERFLI